MANCTIEATRVAKHPRSGWEAETAIRFAAPVTVHGRAGHRVLTFRTYKTGHGDLLTTASVALHAGDMVTTVLFGDYHKTLVRGHVRATEKSVREQHARALRETNAIVAEAEAFYARLDAEAAA
jgi:hypothetical protein